MKSEIVNVTPQLAADWLAANTCNRPLRRTVVDGLKAAFARGEYVQTHQGVAFSLAGELLDGQHRLTAISELRDGVFPMLVTTGLLDEAFKVMDIGLKRTAADSLQEEDKRLVECARLIAVICMSRRGSVTPTLLIPIIDAIRKPHTSLIAFCPTTTKMWSAAPVRLAAILTMMTGGDADYVRMIYSVLVHGKYEAMPPIVRALYKSYVNGQVRAADYQDTIARCLKAFSVKHAQTARVQINDAGEALARVRSVFGHLIEHEVEIVAPKKKAAPTGAAKSVTRFDFSQLTARR